MISIFFAFQTTKKNHFLNENDTLFKTLLLKPGHQYSSHKAELKKLSMTQNRPHVKHKKDSEFLR